MVAAGQTEGVRKASATGKREQRARHPNEVSSKVIDVFDGGVLQARSTVQGKLQRAKGTDASLKTLVRKKLNLALRFEG